MTDLFTPTQFKTHVGIPAAVTEWDAYIAELAADVTEFVDDELRRTVEQAVYTEIHDGTGKSFIRICNPPIAASPAPILYVSGSQTWDAAHKIAIGDFDWEAGSGKVRLKSSAANPDLFPQDLSRFPNASQVVRVDYTGGWLAASRPAALRRGAIIWAVAIFNQRRASGIGSRTVGGVSFVPSQKGVPIPVLGLIAKYRMPFRSRTVGAP
jgi:hypothetical protein